MAKSSVAAIRKRRRETLLACWIKVVEHFRSYALVPQLDPARVEKVIEDYTVTHGAFIKRYKIKDRIQRHKIAGLMAASILKHKPVSMNDRDHSPVHEATQANEILAFWHGLAVCAEGCSGEDSDRLIGHSLFLKWMGDLISLFEHHPGSPEAFAVIFGTLSLTFFPQNLGSASGDRIPKAKAQARKNRNGAS